MEAVNNQVQNLIQSKTVFQRIMSYVGLGPEEEYMANQNMQNISMQRNGIQNHNMSNANTGNTQVFQTPVTPTGPQVVEAKDFSDSQKIADLFRANCPVIMNIESTHTKYTRRLVDFASGLVYGLNGTIRSISSHIFLLEPKGTAGMHDAQTYLEEARTTGFN